jgi:predicted AAA+ superfamily ATPase
MTNTPFIARHLQPLLSAAMADTPALLVNGPRQCGKTTLARKFAENMAYVSLDDPALLAAAKTDPIGFIRRHDAIIIDEIQRAPELLMAIKLSIDNDRRPGRFLLTGSANLMALPTVADSLAGRMEVHTLLPFSNAELAERPADFLDRAIRQDWPEIFTGKNPDETFEAQVLAGGYPEMRRRSTPARRQAWANAYLTTLVERDIHDVAEIEHSARIPQLLATLATLSGQLINLQQIGGQLGLNGKTVEKYIGVLEKLFLVRRLPAWSRNELSRLVKTPKLHFLDAGLQATLTRLTPQLASREHARFGATLESWVHGELLKNLSVTQDAWFLAHYRDKDQVEIDFVLESPLREIIGIEVKASATIGANDFKGVKRLRDICGKSFLSGIVLYDGDHVLPFGDGLWAVPLHLL